MRRSLLFIPGNNPGMLQNASLFNADGVIFDLEDAVSIDDKDSARFLVQNFLESFPVNDIEVIVRINGFDTNFYEEDIAAIIGENLDTIMVPKAHSYDLVKLDEILSTYENKLQLPKKIKVIPIIELAESLLEVEAIGKLPRVDGILLGAEDLTSDMEVERTVTGEEIAYARSKISLTCKAYKIDAIDTPFTNTGAEDLLLNDCKQALVLGMNAKACIHPNQILTVNDVFSPSEKVIKYASRVIEASKNNVGVFSLDGKMIDKPIIERSQKVIAKAKKFKLL